MPEALLTTKQVAKLKGCGYQTVASSIRSGRLRAVRRDTFPPNFVYLVRRVDAMRWTPRPVGRPLKVRPK